MIRSITTKARTSSGYKRKHLVMLMVLLFSFLQNADAQQWIIGTGTVSNTSSTYPTPFGAFYSGAREQYLYTAAELTAAGITPGNIDELAFNVTAVNTAGAHVAYSVNMKATASTSLAAGWESGTANYYYTPSITPVAGWNAFPLFSPFVWNGTDNIVVEICFWNGTSTYTQNASVAGTTMANMAKSYRADTGGPFCTTASSSTAPTSRPNIRMSRYTPCTGAPAVTITPSGTVGSCVGTAQSFSASVPPLTGGLSFQWESSPTGTAPWTPIAGATQSVYNFNVTAALYYHCVVSCGATSSTSPATQVTVAPPPFASLPYFQDFESWMNYCNNSDVPAGNWANGPSSGNSSWRRDDQGTTAAWTSATSGAVASPVYVSGAHSARFHSYTATANTPGNLDLYLNCSSTTGTKQLYFYYRNNKYSSAGYDNDSLNVLLSTDNGATFSPIGGLDTSVSWKRVAMPIASNSAQTIVRFSGKKYGTDYTDMYIDSVYVALPCSGQPAAGTIATGSQNICAGTSMLLTTNGTSMAGNLTYQWLQQTNGSTTWVPAVGTGANSLFFTTPALNDTIKYRMVVTCAGSNLRDTTPAIAMNVPRVVYGAIPYVEDFENWTSRCNTTEVPTVNWTNAPYTGNPSWRRHDQGASAGWTSPTSYLYSPTAIHGSYSARFHSGATSPAGTQGFLSLYLDCSTIPGTKELQFYYINTSGTDTLSIQLSTDGGTTFNTLGNYPTIGSWTLYTLPITSNSAQTVIRFRARSDYGSTDIGLDYVRVLPPCSGKPTAGAVKPVTPCANTNFNLELTGTSQSAGLTYQWQESANGTTWANMNNGTQLSTTANINLPTYYRCIVTCGNSTQADTTAPYKATLAPFYMCYCNSTATSTADDDIGNVTVSTYPANVTLMNNGTAAPLTSNAASTNLYTDFRNTVAPVVMYKDSTYRLSLTQINSGSFYACKAAAYIDYDRNGIFDAGELVFTKVTSSSSTPAQQVNDTFTVPDTAHLGLTGFRIILVEGSSATINPCGTYTYGETEDYLIDLRNPPCNGPSNPGVAFASAASMCAGYDLLLTDTTYEKERSGLSRVWQKSGNYGSSWSNIAGGNDRDTMTVLFTGDSWYRLKMVCTITGDSTFSNVVKVSIKPPYKCYCYSMANGGAKDTTDFGSMTLSKFLVAAGGPHLLNPKATSGRTDYTDLGPIELFVDSTYQLDLYQTMPNATHADARVTMFIDFNNNLQYDIPSERINLTSDVTNVNDWYLVNHFTVPSAAVINVPTGMRLIINNNLAPNVPSDEACGAYTSGETEDFVVVIRKGVPSTTGVSVASNLQDLVLYPNPTNGRFLVTFNSDKAVKDLSIEVTTITGQRVYQEASNNVGSSFSKEIDLSTEARGIYFVTITADGEKVVRKVTVQ